MEYKDNTILIVPNSIKKDILLSIDKLVNIKIYSINEFIKKYYFDYDEKTIYYVANKYNVKSEIVKIYIDNLYYIGDIEDEKIKFLKELKKDLIDNDLLIYNELFKESIKGKTVEFISIPNTLYNKKLIDNLENICEVKIKEIDNKKYVHKYKHFNTLEDEVVYVAESICNLITKGIDINNIYITNLSDEHKICVNKIFKMFNIPFKLKNNNSIYGTTKVFEFLDNFNSDLKNSFEIISNNLNTKEDEYIYNSLVNIVNKYYFVDDYNLVKDMIINDIKKTKTLDCNFTNSVKEVDFLDYNFKDEDYVFLLHLNQGVLPKIYKDENYLSDKVMEKLGLDTAPIKNKLEKEKTISKIQSIKNLYISYIDKSLSNNYLPSSIIEELSLEEDKDNNIKYNYSNIYNKIKLVSYRDLYTKYNEINEYLPILNNTYKLNVYDNNYKKINKDNLIKYLNNNLYLSYTSLTNYYKCSFRYYISNILKLDIYEDSFMQILGDIFHEVLENYFKKKKNFDELYDEIIKNMNYEYSIKERFFLKKLKSELKFVVDTIEEQNNYSDLKDEEYEKKVVTNIEGNINITFTGKIDKLKYTKKDNKTILAIIDYKTGNPELNINNVLYGLDMQLPVYIYLAKNIKELDNIEVVGFYLQKILNNEITYDYKKDYKTEKKDLLKLQGYSIDDLDLLPLLDHTYEDSSVIKNLKITSNGFYQHSKIINKSGIEKLVNIVKDNIKNGADNIINANFNINPKQIGNDNVGCLYCKYKNICYMTENNIEVKKKYKDLEFLGGDDNA